MTVSQCHHMILEFVFFILYWNALITSKLYDEMYQNASNDNIDVKTNFISDMYRVYIYLKKWRSISFVAQFVMYV